VRISLAVHELSEAVGYLKTLRSLIFGKAFPADPRKISNLVLTVDQEVGGSNPPSCANHIAPPVPSLLFVRFVAAQVEAPRHQASTRLRSGDLHFGADTMERGRRDFRCL
jgi:hypothetical protein